MSNENQCGECGQDIPVQPPKMYYRQEMEVYVAPHQEFANPVLVCSCNNIEMADIIVNRLMEGR